MMSQKVAYLMSRFPTIAETFILYEMLELKRLGLQIEIFPLIHQKETTRHADVDRLAAQVHHSPFFSAKTMAAQFYWLYKKPKAYLGVWWKSLRNTLKSPKFFSRSLVVVPMAALYARQMEELGIQHLHAHAATHPTLAAYVVKQLTDLPYSFTAHSSDIFFNQTMLAEKIRQASFVITVSEYNRRFLVNRYYELVADKLHVIHCGVDPELFQTKAAVRTDNRFTIICVARLNPKKGHHYLIEACAQLKAQGIEFCCLLVGDGELRADIKNRIRQLDLADRITLVGFQPHHHVRQLLTQADVMVLPSISEGIPVVLMEALAMKLPVVATAITGIPELVEDGKTGLLVPTRDPQALAAAILKLYHARAWGQQLGVGGQIKVMKEFNLRINTANLYFLFTQQQVGANISTG